MPSSEARRLMQFAFWEATSSELESDDETGDIANRIGKAGEYIVAADLEIAGYRCSIASEGLPFDLIATDEDGNVHLVQVKTVSRPKDGGYQFKGYKHRPGRGRKRGLCDYKDVDVLAFVALDKRAVLYARTSDIATKSVNILDRRYVSASVRALSLESAFVPANEVMPGGDA
jgi:hypothetical protein